VNNAKAKDAQQQEVQDLVKVVDRASLIENLMDQVILNYCAPRERAQFFMSEIILNTSVMSLGAKAKVVMAAAHTLDFKLDKEAILKTISLRNAFAHHATNANPVIVFSNTPEDEYSYLSFWLLTSSGEIEMVKRHEAFEKFNAVYLLARESLKNLLGCIAEHLASGVAPKVPMKQSKPKSPPAKK
jgi:hypothetical protein